MRVFEILEASARRWPDKPAIIDAKGALTYRELLQAVEEVRERLEGNGIGPGAGVGMRGGNGRGFVIGAFAASAAGAVVATLPAGEREDPAGLRAVLDASGAGRSVGCGLGLVERPSPSSSFAGHVAGAAFVRMTSGTTGRAKGVVLTHRDVVDRTAAANKGLRVAEGERVLWVLPMACHFFVSIVLYLRYGATILVPAEEGAAAALDSANRWGATFLYASPPVVRELLALDSPARFQTLRRAFSTAAALPPADALAFHQRFGLPIAQAFGIIEAGLPLVNADAALERPESVGRPLPDYEVALFDENTEALGEGAAEGRLAVRGPGMLSGYLDPPEGREDILGPGGWFLTGDVARRDAEGYVVILGRAASIIRLGDRSVFPEEVEAVLNQHAAVRESHVFSESDPTPVLCAEFVADPGADVPAGEDLRDWCRDRLEAFAVPDRVRAVQAIRHTPSGKIERGPRS